MRVNLSGFITWVLNRAGHPARVSHSRSEGVDGTVLGLFEGIDGAIPILGPSITTGLAEGEGSAGGGRVAAELAEISLHLLQAWLA